MIDSFSGTHLFLSNFYQKDFVHQGQLYISGEHAFQAAKSLIAKEVMTIISASSPNEAKRLGRMCTLRVDWERIKYDVMSGIVRSKFQVPELQLMLLNTGDEFLVEYNHWHDTTWGVCDGRGRNWLGNILMTVRDELKLWA